VNHPKPTSLKSLLAGLCAAGLIPLGLSLSAAGCGGGSSGSVGVVTNALIFSPVNQDVLGNGIEDRFYRQTFTVTSGGTPPYRFSNINNALPSGLFLVTARADGSAIVTSTQTEVVGFPNSAGATQITFQAFDLNNERTDPFYTFAITPSLSTEALLVLPTNGSISTTQVGTAYVATLTAANGAANFNWRVVYGGLPPGLTFSANPSGSNSAEAGISGTPTQSGTWFFGVEVDDQSSPQRSSGAIYQFTVNP
jgi:putative Ig domain-containing protein